ncbi:flavin monoamine oxidase family protein [Clostridium paridis]|uniref:FAD-dependent oxidoreductase n=1 Tax=Clostridium paridis TaxID=2803863 RepID=A0A937FC36_9CLOT|nr:NAD(P)/FAD-dependent oxidoreductase [Clostridium paridis]MBL4931164.1 FAD-dependent oxidoreductase [Clostridium paridis]
MNILDLPGQPSNPTNEQRYSLIRSDLAKAGREEDFNNIINLLGPPPNIINYASHGSLKGKKVGIIGGGLAGMSSAFELRKLGCDITIFEARNRIGGRVFTHYFDDEKKIYGELGAIRIPVTHETTWHYINLFNLNTYPFIQYNPNAFLYILNTRLRNNPEEIQRVLYPKFNLTPRERSTPWPELYNYAFNSPIKTLPPNIRTELLKILPVYNPKYIPLLNISVRQNLELLGLSNEAIQLLTSVDAFSGSLIDEAYNEILQENYPIFFQHLYRIDGGNVNLPLAFYYSLLSQKPKEYDNIPNEALGTVNWIGGYWVSGIHKNEAGDKVIITYKNKELTETLNESFDYVVCAIPFTTLKTVDIDPVFSNRKMEAIREIAYVNGHRTIYLCKKRFWEEDTPYGGINGGISYTDSPLTTTLYPSDHINNPNPNEPGVLVASYNLHMDATSLANISPIIHNDIVATELEKLHGLPKGFLKSIVEKTMYISWDMEEWSRGAVCHMNAGQKRVFSYEITRPEYNNRIFFAGEHASVSHGWMQGSLYTGMQAANQLAYYANAEKHSI